MPERQATPGEATEGDQVASGDEPTVETAHGFRHPGSQAGPSGGPTPRPRPGPGGPSDPQAQNNPQAHNPPQPTDDDDPTVPGDTGRGPSGRAPENTDPRHGAPQAGGPAPAAEQVPADEPVTVPESTGSPDEPAAAAPPDGGSTVDDATGKDVAEPADHAPQQPSGEQTGIAENASDAQAAVTGRPSGPSAVDDETVVLDPGNGRGGAGNAWFVSLADEPTQTLPRPRPAPPAQTPISQAMASADPVTERLPVPPKAQEDQLPPDSPPSDGLAEPGRPRRRRKVLLAIGGLLVLAGIAYGGDLLLSQGVVPRGVTVAGVAVGGLDPAAAEQRLRAEIEPRASRPVQVRLEEATSTIDPEAAGLSVNWSATMAAVTEQPLNPVTRLTSLLGSRDVGVVTDVDYSKLDPALTELAPIVNRPASEGTVKFTGSTPRAMNPEPGRELDVRAAAAVVRRDWTSGAEVALPLTTVPPATTPEGVARAVDVVARPAVASPFTVAGEGGTSITLTPEQIATVLAFKPGTGGELIGEVNPAELEQAVGQTFTASERPSRDATIDISTGAPVVVPSQDGRGVDYEATAVAMGPPLISAGQRRVAAVYAEKRAELTTEKLKELGITELVSEFATRGFATDSGRNIKRAAEQINGTVLQPGATFSLNGKTNPRDASNGYVEAGIIEDGHPSRGVGGGVSQVATTTYNAAYFAGMTLVEHKEHSFYISRYPAGREATVFNDLIDLKFRNDSPTAIMIQTVWTPSSITVRFFGTKYYEVTSATGPRTAPTEPKTVTIPSGEPCEPSKGAPGFTVTDTRTLRDLRTGAVRSDPTRTVRYNPSPIVECGE